MDKNEINMTEKCKCGHGVYDHDEDDDVKGYCFVEGCPCMKFELEP